MINHLLPVQRPYIQQYNTKIYDGIQLLKNSNITVISLVRNIGQKLNRNIDIVAGFFQENSKSYSHIFFENDSTDDTKNILSKYIEQYPTNLHIISQNFNRAAFGPVKNEARIKALSEYRNTTKQYAKKIDSDFIIVLDMDFDDISLSGLLNSFGWLVEKQDITAVAGNSFQYKPGLYREDPSRYNLWNYDSWAFRLNWWPDLQNYVPAPQNTIDPMIWFGFWIPPTGSLPIEVNSAFGGCCIYRSNIYFEADYDFSDCEHVCFHHNLYSNKNINFKLVLNPSQQMVFKE
jgi:hypothetical protein